MKILLLTLLATLLFVASSCDERAIDINFESFNLEILDSNTMKPLSNYDVKVYYMFEFGEHKDFEKYIIGILPNPTSEKLSIGFSIQESGVYTLKVLNQLLIGLIEAHDTLFEKVMSPGYHTVEFDFTKFENFHYGFYNIYLEKDDEIIDSSSFCYWDKTRLEEATIKDAQCEDGECEDESYTVYYAAQYQTTQKGRIIFDSEFFQWFNHNTMATDIQGNRLGLFKISEKIFIKVYSPQGNEVYQGIIPYEGTIKTYTLLI